MWVRVSGERGESGGDGGERESVGVRVRESV